MSVSTEPNEGQEAEICEALYLLDHLYAIRRAPGLPEMFGVTVTRVTRDGNQLTVETNVRSLTVTFEKFRLYPGGDIRLFEDADEEERGLELNPTRFTQAFIDLLEEVGERLDWEEREDNGLE